MLFNYKYVLILILLLFATSCFTEVENTKKITEKDVEKVLQNQKNSNLQESIYNNVSVDSFPNWEKGRKFYVVDSNVRRIFTTSVLYDIDTLDF